MTTPPDGTPVVLLNAFPVDRSQWEGLIVELAPLASGDIIAFDIPGIGEMPMTDEEPSLELIADAAVVAMREATGHQAAIWIGSSMGGYIAMAVAEREPTAVAGLVLIGTKSVADDEQGRAKRLDIAAAVENEPKHPNPALVAEGLIGTKGDARAALVEAITANVGQHSGAGVAWGQRAMAARPDRTAVLRNVDAPSVVIHGELDALASLEDSQVMADALGTTVVVLPGIGHLAAFEAPADVARALAPVFG